MKNSENYTRRMLSTGWFGLDNPMMYAAHKAAGGMTSVYRQIGIGCEKLFRSAVKTSLELSEEDVTWSYQVTLPSGRKPDAVSGRESSP